MRTVQILRLFVPVFSRRESWGSVKWNVLYFCTSLGFLVVVVDGRKSSKAERIHVSVDICWRGKLRTVSYMNRASSDDICSYESPESVPCLVLYAAAGGGEYGAWA